MKMVALSLSLSLTSRGSLFWIFCVHVWKALEGSKLGVFFDRQSPILILYIYIYDILGVFLCMILLIQMMV